MIANHLTHSLPLRSAAFTLGLALGLLADPLLATDLDNGQRLSRQCSVCHGKQGLSSDPEVPNLAGQSAFYIEKSLKDYQSGVRADRRMTLLVKNLSDSDIKDLAAWYESFVIEVSRPE